MQEEKINEFLNGRPFAIISGILLIIAALLFVTTGKNPPADVGNGIFFNIEGVFINHALGSMLVNVACVLGIGLMMNALNKTYNFVRAFTFVFVSAFFLLEMSNPLTSSVFNIGTALCLTLVAGPFILFTTYQDKRAQYSILLVMVILSFCTMFHWMFIVLIPCFVLGFFYMRAMNLRSALAMCIGLLTPFWILLGMGVVKPADFTLPDLITMWDSLEFKQTLMLGVWTAIIALATLVLTVVNLFTIYNYRLQLRVYNAFFAMVTIIIILAMCIDYQDMATYVPILNLCLSVQVAHAFTVAPFTKRYFIVVGLAALCLIEFGISLLVG